MEQISLALGTLCKVLLDIELFAMLMRMISDIFLSQKSLVSRIAFFATEPFILCVRATLSKVKMFSRSPIDIFFFAAFMIIALLELLLGTWF